MALPWNLLIQFTPQIINLSRDLLQRARGTRQAQDPARPVDPADLPQRIAALEENERRQAELVEQMATQLAELSTALVTLHRRQRWLIGAIVLLGAVLLWLAFRR